MVQRKRYPSVWMDTFCCLPFDESFDDCVSEGEIMISRIVLVHTEISEYIGNVYVQSTSDRPRAILLLVRLVLRYRIGNE